mmetsp:Transcript_36447/g.116820  ORF Transcript_36447/g.116820 Transcript_36447/m.116820 type:complete len:182 (+) Transcript_36447:14-559(+)|eukprot:CAMPEP_0118919856 /NCGR_PEP_ID=MMETSP1166-20130328/18772_1 /TAXON_ID=1104430 /ORGANISM="Chrysoreinhardia sp, Strain CCMP3193" /LENGTH=181 /DNA_ID=CAMNT_0006860391 /DNA_START=11 /DNA_END=556 /DNA_ORIENTATION=+
MASRGVDETKRLRQSIEKQLNRLLVQLSDLEELREELEDDEYEETRSETMRELEEFEESLNELTRGNMTLVSELNSVQLAIQGAVRQAFKTPDVIKMFAKREPDALRAKLASLKEEKRLSRISEDAYMSLSVEILLALQKLGEPLSKQEAQILRVNEQRDAFTNAADDVVGTNAIKLAANK